MIALRLEASDKPPRSELVPVFRFGSYKRWLSVVLAAMSLSCSTNLLATAAGSSSSSSSVRTERANAKEIAEEIGQLNDMIEGANFEEASLFGRYLIQKYPNAAVVHMTYARLLRGTGKTDEAVQEYRLTNQLDANLIEPLLALSEMSLENLEIANALKYAREALKVNPLSSSARNLLITGLLQSDRLTEAQQVLEPALRRQDRDPQLWYLAAQIAAKKGDFQKSRFWLERAVSLNQDQTKWTLELCRILENSGDAQSARQYLGYIIAKKPDAVDARLRLARNYEFFAHDYDAAIEVYRKALQIEPNSIQASAGVDRCAGKKNNIALRLKLAIQSFVRGNQ
jgi:tetratricopeptide (TPR) repeat protein